MIDLALPFPPSVNGLYAGFGRRHKSKVYERWLAAARYSLISQEYTPITKKIPLQVHYKFGKPDKRKRDLLNLPKAIEDFLVSQGIIPDDSWVYHATIEWADIVGVMVHIEPLERW